MTGARPLLILGWKGQGQIFTLNFASFPHDNSITFLHTIIVLHTWVHHDPRRTDIDFWVIWSKVKVKCGLWTLQIFRTITITFWTAMMILEACVACDMRSNSIDFGVKVKHRMVYFFVVAGGYMSLLGQVSIHSEVILFTNFWEFVILEHFHAIFMDFRAIVLKACWLSKSS